ncbi:MAG TPA: insulinase family protein [Chitinophagaceae bacterium]|nr:insulinase family protein [Chitinophagaceae bacterium]
MKKIFCTIFSLIFLVSLCQAQIGRSHAPKPGPAPEINLGSPATFTTPNGIKVFVVENHKVPQVTVSLILKRDPVLEKDKVGYVGMAGQVMRRGTTTKSKAQLDEEIDFLGGNVQTSSSSASASALTQNFDKTFAILSDVILHPAFADSELAKVKTQTLSGLQAAKDNPDAISANVTDVANYGKDYPYGEVETDSTVKNITVEDLKNYYNTYWKPNIAYMAFVGDISPTHARKLIDRYLGDWKKGKVPEKTYPVPQAPTRTDIFVVNRPSAVQTNINITAPLVLKPGQPDNFPVKVMNQILGGGSSGRLFQDLREKYGFTYGAYSDIHNDPLVGSFSASAAVRTSVTDSALGRFMYELNRIRDAKVGQAKLDSAKNQLSGNFALALERPSLIAQFALNIARYNMPKDYYKNYLKSIAAVSVDDVQQAARKYITPGQTNIVLVGNAEDFSGKLGGFGSVKYVDIYGNPVQAPVHKAVPTGVTAKGIITRYLQAIGGEDKLKDVKDLSMTLSAEMMGQQIVMHQKFLSPDQSLMTMTLPSRKLVVMKIRVDGDSVAMQSMGRPVPMTDARKAELREGTDPFPEMHFLDGKDSLKLTGIEDVNGSDAYALEVTDALGKTTTYYFDTKTGYELRKVSSENTPKGKIRRITDMSNYREVAGINFPHSIVSQNGPQKMSMTVQEIKVNSGLQKSDFK